MKMNFKGTGKWQMILRMFANIYYLGYIKKKFCIAFIEYVLTFYNVAVGLCIVMATRTCRIECTVYNLKDHELFSLPSCVKLDHVFYLCS